MYWYDGGQTIPRDLVGGLRIGQSGALMIGEKAVAYSSGDYGGSVRLDKNDIAPPEVEFRRTSGRGGHFGEWIAAVQGGEPAVSNFPDYAGPLTESILLGNFAVWAAAGEGPGKECEGPKVLWDAKNLKCTNIEGLEPMVKPTYREGHVLDV
jgi:hypothetical protein